MLDKLEQRMYGLVMCNISPIQQGIQYGHALQEFNNMMIANESPRDSTAFNRWRLEDKTFIIMNGGTSNERHTSSHYGSMNIYRDALYDNEILHAPFYEPDLNDSLSAIVFLVDERVFDFKKYPAFKLWLESKIGADLIRANKKKYPMSDIETIFDLDYTEWKEFIGGDKNVFLKTFIKQFRLA